MRDRALFDLAIDSKLCGCDLVKMKIGDIVAGEDIRTRASLLSRLERRGGTAADYIVPSRLDHKSGHSATQNDRFEKRGCTGECLIMEWEADDVLLPIAF